MKRRVAPNRGFWLTFLLNLLFRAEWLMLAVVLFVLHKLLPLPLWVASIPLGIWVVLALALTLLADWATSTSELKPAPNSKRSSERIEQFKNEQKR